MTVAAGLDGSEPVQGSSEGTLATNVYRKFARYLLPTLCAMYFISWLDRQNVSFAKLEMLGDLHLSERAFGLGASLFFVGYAIAGVPSGLAMRRFGPSRCFAIMMTGWGIATVALMVHPSEVTFYALRFAVGMLEGGFAPGIFYYLSLWAPFEQRARFMGLFLSAGMLSNAIGAPICGILLDLEGTAGMQGWQWLFLLTGLPAIMLGLSLPWLLTDSPEKARFYSPGEKNWLAGVLAAEQPHEADSEPAEPLLRAILDRRLLGIAAVLFGNATASFGLAYWLPTVVREFGVSSTVNGFLNSLPWLSALVALTVLPVIGRRTGRWGYCAGFPLLAAAAALLAIVWVPTNALRLALLCVAAAGIFAPSGILSGLSSVFLRRSTAAPALGAVNAAGMLGGFAAQNAIPAIFAATGSVLAPMLLLSAVLLATALGAFVLTSRIVGNTAR